MKSLLIAFHLFMVILYLAVGGIFLFSNLYLNLISGTTRTLMGVLFMLYALYRAYSMYRNVIRQ